MFLFEPIPKGRGDEPAEAKAPIGPNTQESTGNTSPTRTYQDLLQNPYDEALFEHYTTGQLTVIDLEGNVTPVGKPGIYSGVSISPDGEHLMVTEIKKPFSYLLTYRSFPQSISVWNLKGEREFLVADVPLAENIPIEGVRTGPRNVRWRTGFDATLVWTEALDGGDPNKEADFRDEIKTVSAPFKDEPTQMMKVQYRAYGLSHFKDRNLVATTEYDRDRRWVRTLLHDTRPSPMQNRES